MSKPLKHSRAQDAARNAQEIASGQRAARKKANTKPAPEPVAEPKKRGRPPNPKPEVQPTKVSEPLPPTPVDSTGKPLSAFWDIVRGQYSPTIVAVGDAFLSRNQLKLDDLILLEAVELAKLNEWMNRPRIGDRTKERAVSLAIQCRKQLARLMEIKGGNVGSANDIQVRIPLGLNLFTIKPSTGHRVLAEPTEAELPESMRTLAKGPGHGQ